MERYQSDRCSNRHFLHLELKLVQVGDTTVILQTLVRVHLFMNSGVSLIRVERRGSNDSCVADITPTAPATFIFFPLLPRHPIGCILGPSL